MSTEDTSKLDKAVVAEDNKSKTDLNDTGDAVVDDGKGTVPIKQDPFQSRKAIFKKATGMREQLVQADADAHVDIANVREAIDNEMDKGSSRNELDRGDHFDTNRTQVERRAPAATAAEEVVNDGGEHVDTGNGRVKVKVLGQEFEVPQGDVDAAGGITAYQKDRAASIRLQAAAQREADLKAEREKLEAERRDWEQQRASAGAPSTVAPASTHSGDAGKGADVAKKATEIVDAIYSGDRKATEVAIQEILARNIQQPALSAEELARQAAELLKKQGSAPAPAKPVDAKVSVEVQELNAYMADNYSDLMANDEQRNAAVAEFNRLKALPENYQRRWVDLGREAAESVLKPKQHARQDVLDKKRSLPPVAAGTHVHSPAASPASTSPSSAVAMMRKARGLPS